MFRSFLFLLGGICCWLQAADACGHFLFIRINPHAEAGRAVEVFFSERAAAGDPRFIQKIAGTALSMQAEPGKFQALQVRQGIDRLRAALPASGPVAVDGMLRYGVLTREAPFLLEYYPKAIAGEPSALNALKPHGDYPVEIVAIVNEDTITLSLLKNGKPVPKAKFTTVDDDLVNEELQADEAGRVTWKPDASGHYSVYTKVVEPTTGDYEGTKYTEIRRFPTLAFHWPTVRRKADPAAVALFEKAIAVRAVWKSFSGFTAEVAGSADGRQFEGSVTIDADGAVEVDIDEENAAEWVENQLGSIVLHRRASSSVETDPVLWFADNDDSHPLGRLLTFSGGSFASSYRVKDGQIRMVNRNFGKQNMTITVLDTTQNDEGKYLPHLYLVQYWNVADGRLTQTQTVQSRWQRVGTLDLPALITTSRAAEAGLTVRSVQLSNHKLLPTQTEK